MTHISHEELLKQIEKAANLVKIDREYIHYKYPDKRYKVINIGIQEATEKVCVIYCDMSSPNIHFVRDLNSWLEKVEYKGTIVPRFQPAILKS